MKIIPRPSPKRHTTRKKVSPLPSSPIVGSPLQEDHVKGRKKGGGKGSGRRHRTSSTGSLSEEDVFVITEVSLV